MPLDTKIKLPDIYIGEYGEYQRLSEKFDRTTSGQAQYTNPDTLASYDTTGTVYDGQGENGLLLLLFNEDPTLKTYIFDIDTYNDLKSELDILNQRLGDWVLPVSNNRLMLNELFVVAQVQSQVKHEDSVFFDFAGVDNSELYSPRSSGRIDHAKTYSETVAQGTDTLTATSLLRDKDGNTPNDVTDCYVKGEEVTLGDAKELINLVTNYDISNGTNGYGAVSSVLSTEGNILKNTGDGSSTVCRTVQDLGIQPNGDKMLGNSRIRVTNGDCDTLQFFLRDGTSGTVYDIKTVSNPIQDEWYELTNIPTIGTLSNNLFLIIDHLYPSTALANGAVLEIDGVNGVFTFNLSENNVDAYLDALGYTTDQQKADYLASVIQAKGAFEKDSIGQKEDLIVDEVNVNIVSGEFTTITPDWIELENLGLIVGQEYTCHTLANRVKIAVAVGSGGGDVLLDSTSTNTTFVWTQDADDRMSVFLRDTNEDLDTNEVQIQRGNTFTGYVPFNTVKFTTNIQNTYVDGANLYRSNVKEEGGKYVFDGFETESANPNVDTWDEVQSSAPENWAFIANVGTDIYVRGVADGSILKYDTLTDTWDNTLASTSGLYVEMVGVGTKVYCKLNANNKMIAYDTLTDTWDETGSAPSGTWAYPTTDGNDKIYTRSSNNQGIWEYTISTDTWNETLSQVGENISYSTYNNGKVYFKQNTAPYKIFEYDIIGNAWTTTLANPSGSWSYLEAHENKIYVKQDLAPYRIWVYDVVGNSWDETKPTPSGTWAYPVNVNGQIYVRGSDNQTPWFFDAREIISTTIDVTDVDIRLNISAFEPIDTIASWLYSNNIIGVTYDAFMSVHADGANEVYVDLVDSEVEIDDSNNYYDSTGSVTTPQENATLKVVMTKVKTSDSLEISRVQGAVG